MKPINEYVEYELSIFRNECNFSDEEMEFFNLCAKGYGRVRISAEMNTSTSTIYRLSQAVNKKMKRVEELILKK